MAKKDDSITLLVLTFLLNPRFSQMSKLMKYQDLIFSIIFFLILITTLDSDNSCTLNFQPSSSIYSNCKPSNYWGGFITNSTCCGAVFDDYLYALGQRANQSGQIFLNSTEQEKCLISMQETDKNGSACGIEKLTSGASGCASYNKVDVANRLPKRVEILDEECKFLDSDDKYDQICSTCLRKWQEIDGSSDNETESKDEADICRFAVLVTLTSSRIDDTRWVQAVYKCLSVQNVSVANEQETVTEDRANLSTGMLVLIIGFVGVMVAIISILAWKFRKRFQEIISRTKSASHDFYSERSSSLSISIKEIYSATNYFDASNYIGQGIAGKVYKGILSNGQHVAIKHITNDEQGETFVREVRSLSHVRHPNLVALLGYYEDKDESFLVYELCHNGNISEWLYDKDRTLSWIERLHIAIDSAKGLWFLHTYEEGCIVHRDIKPTNILISADFQAKLADFGLSKVMDVDQSYVSSEVRGTFGYVDPEYQQNHHVNAKGDVYSFGIVLLQLLSGQRVINMDSNKPMQLNKMAKLHARGGNITEFADPKLNGEYSAEAFNLVLNLALSCTGIKHRRPTMEQVVIMLDKALGISTHMNSVRYNRAPYTD